MLKFSKHEEDLMLNCEYSRRLLSKLNLLNTENQNKIDISQIRTAICYAKHYHGDQRRDSGEPYYSHPLEVAYMVSENVFKTDIIITAILHDTIEDTELTRKMIEEAFGAKIAEQVYDLTRVKDDGVKITSAKILEDLWFQKKHDILIIKILDRIHNMQTIYAKSPEKIEKIIEETIKNFLIASIDYDNQQIYELLQNLCIPGSNSSKSELQGSSRTILHSINYLLPSLNSQNILRLQHKK